LTLTSYEIIAIFCLLHISCLSVMKINVWHGIEHHNLTHQLTGGVHDSKHAHVPKAIIFITRRYASRRLCRGRVSVRLSVCLSRSCILSRWLKISSDFFVGPVAPSF